MDNKKIGLYYFSKNNISYCAKLLFAFYLLVLLSSCTSQSSKESVEIKKLYEYNKIVTNQDAELANPTNLRYNSDDSCLFVYDGGQHKVLELNKEGQVVDEFGRRGRGPGEFLKVKNIFLTDNNLYTVDPLQFRLTRFSLEGGETQTLNYGNGNLQSMPPPAPQSLEPRAQNINNQPVVTLNGNVLLSNIQLDTNGKKLYRLIEWKNKYISEVGDIPNGSLFTLDYDKYKSAIAEKEIPSYYKPNAFPIVDHVNPDEFYLIYSAFPKITKYDTLGNKLWERKVPESAEMDSVSSQFYRISNQLRGESRVELKKYVAGVSDTEGNLYLALGKYYNDKPSFSLWIHKFDEKGTLITRYKLISKRVNLSAIFDIDSDGNRIFVITGRGEIRAYSLD